MTISHADLSTATAKRQIDLENVAACAVRVYTTRDATRSTRESAESSLSRATYTFIEGEKTRDNNLRAEIGRVAVNEAMGEENEFRKAIVGIVDGRIKRKKT